MDQLNILKKIKMIPVAYQQEVEDFIDFILQKKVNKKDEENSPRKLGLLKGKMSDDFNAPLDDFKDYMQ
ncbi:type II toxin-antitoxin system VapB family antitoxin [Pedobacter alluvionis]|uniref:DUF2281 domain-containing protein n=1 Tax=Pedobacter alluvionis TaxID=475253 RepID=A0A497XYD2_9SPHI|nr:DUF2281 domain-containing protein [Pedobacter alluvionis]RLJ71953.1 uncharacterized protein DUF2281 [Pedobacter alluvionis]TFB28733.1 DUF2281 domain-containing protein [Pedobacter alluvionis]